MKRYSWPWLKSLISARVEPYLPLQPFSWSGWLKSLFAPRVRTVVGAWYLPKIEQLENRITPTTYTWTGLGGDGNWGTAGNWDMGVPVSSPTTALIFPTTASVNTANNIGPTAGVPFTVGSITVTGAGYTVAGPNPVEVDNNGASGSGAINVSGPNTTISMDMDLVGSEVSINVQSGGALTVSGHLEGASGTELLVNGNGAAPQSTLVLSANNSVGGTLPSGFAGPMDVHQGVLSITNAKALGTNAATNTVNVESSATLEVDNSGGTLTNATPIPQSLTLSGTGSTGAGIAAVQQRRRGNNDATWSGNITFNTNTTIAATSSVSPTSGQGTFTISGVITSTNNSNNANDNLTFNNTPIDTGEIILSAANTYQGYNHGRQRHRDHPERLRPGPCAARQRAQQRRRHGRYRNVLTNNVTAWRGRWRSMAPTPRAAASR